MLRYKQGYIREDGLIFWRNQNGKDYWITIDLFKERRNRVYKNAKIRHKNNPEKRKLKDWKRYYNNTEKEKQRVRNWYCKNAEKAKEKARNHHRKNPSYIREYVAKKREKDPIYKFASNIRSLIANSIKNKGYKKDSKTEDILGCSFAFFTKYIEQRFQEGMTWENRSEWHIDHIFPLASAKTEKEILKLNNYKNLRPLWKSDNISKSNKMPYAQLDLIAKQQP
jgi:hypothetical protein